MTAAEHEATIVEAFSEWSVSCSCGFVVKSLSSYEASEDTLRWHLRQSSYLGMFDSGEVG